MLGLHDILPSGFHLVHDVLLTSTTWLQTAGAYVAKQPVRSETAKQPNSRCVRSEKI